METTHTVLSVKPGHAFTICEAQLKPTVKEILSFFLGFKEFF